MFNHLPWYTAKKSADRLNAAGSLLAAAALAAPPKPPRRAASDSGSESLSGSEGSGGSEEFEGEVLEAGEGDTTVQSIAPGDSFEPPAADSALPPLAEEQPKRGGGLQRTSTAKASNLSSLSAMRAARAKEMEVPASFASFRMNYDQRLAQQKVNVIKMLKSTVSAQRDLYGQTLVDMEDIFTAVDADGSGTVDVREFRDGIKRLGLGLTEPQIQEMIAVFDEDGNGEIDRKEFMDLVNAPVINVSAVARQEWLASREKAEAAEERLKAQAYALARKEAEAATRDLQKEADEKFRRQQKAKAAKEKQLAKVAKEEAKEVRRRAKEGVATRRRLKAEREERMAARLSVSQQRKRDHKLWSSRSLEEVSARHKQGRASTSLRIAEGHERRESSVIEGENLRAAQLDVRREEREVRPGEKSALFWSFFALTRVCPRVPVGSTPRVPNDAGRGDGEEAGAATDGVGARHIDGPDADPAEGAQAGGALAGDAAELCSAGHNLEDNEP